VIARPNWLGTITWQCIHYVNEYVTVMWCQSAHFIGRRGGIPPRFRFPPQRAHGARRKTNLKFVAFCRRIFGIFFDKSGQNEWGKLRLWSKNHQRLLWLQMNAAWWVRTPIWDPTVASEHTNKMSADRSVYMSRVVFSSIFERSSHFAKNLWHILV